MVNEDFYRRGIRAAVAAIQRHEAIEALDSELMLSDFQKKNAFINGYDDATKYMVLMDEIGIIQQAVTHSGCDAVASFKPMTDDEVTNIFLGIDTANHVDVHIVDMVITDAAGRVLTEAEIEAEFGAGVKLDFSDEELGKISPGAFAAAMDTAMTEAVAVPAEIMGAADGS